MHYTVAEIKKSSQVKSIFNTLLNFKIIILMSLVALPLCGMSNVQALYILSNVREPRVELLNYVQALLL